jgi:hypothetical protein
MNCQKNYKILEKDLCYGCHIKKFGKIPTTGLYHQNKPEGKMDLKKKIRKKIRKNRGMRFKGKR